MATIEKAIEIAARAHAGQVDKGGEPYIFHPLRLMMSMQSASEQMVAVLHDVIEDSDVTFGDLRKEGFGEDVIAALMALTKQKGEDRVSAAHRAAAHPIARMVKIADVKDNMNLKRISNPTPKDHERLLQYQKVLQILEAGNVSQ